MQRQPLTGLAKHVLQSGDVAIECVQQAGDLHTISGSEARSVMMLKLEGGVYIQGSGMHQLGVVEFTKALQTPHIPVRVNSEIGTSGIDNACIELALLLTWGGGGLRATLYACACLPSACGVQPLSLCLAAPAG